jgi:hypothetical protein
MHVCRIAEREAAAAAATAAETSGAAAPPIPETPYSAPGGRWGKFKKYSVWQVRAPPIETVNTCKEQSEASSKEVVGAVPCCVNRLLRMNCATFVVFASPARQRGGHQAPNGFVSTSGQRRVLGVDGDQPIHMVSRMSGSADMHCGHLT